MNYINLGPVRIPYKVKVNGDKKIFRIFGINIPFETIIRDNRKLYKFFGITLRIPFINKYLDKI